MRIPIFIMFQDSFFWTKICLDSIFKYTDKEKYDIILINNGSSKKILDKVKSIDGIYKLINYDQKIGVHAAYNDAIEKYAKDSKYFAIVHNDTFVTEGWLDGLVGCFDRSYDKVSEPILSVYPRTNYCTFEKPSNYDKDLRVEFIKNKEEHKQIFSEEIINNTLNKTYAKYGSLDNYAKNVNEKNKDTYKIEEDTFSFCTLFDTNIFFELGKFDEEFLTVHGADALLSFKAKENGYFSINCLDVFVHHNGNTTSSGFGKEFQADFTEAQELLQKKILKEKKEKNSKIALNTKMKKESCSVLIIRENGIGDIIMSLFAVNGLKEFNDNIKITYATNYDNIDFLKNFRCIDSLVPLGVDYVTKKVKTDEDIKNIESFYESKQNFDIIINLEKMFEKGFKTKEFTQNRIDTVKEYVSHKMNNLSFDVSPPKYSVTDKNMNKMQKINEFFGGKSYVVLAPFATCEIRSMSKSLVEGILKKESNGIVI